MAHGEAAASKLNTSPTAKKHHSRLLGRIKAAFRDFPDRVEGWAASDVPILSPQITSRRSQCSRARRSQFHKGTGMNSDYTSKVTNSSTAAIQPQVGGEKSLRVEDLSTFGTRSVPLQLTNDRSVSESLNHGSAISFSASGIEHSWTSLGEDLVGDAEQRRHLSTSGTDVSPERVCNSSCSGLATVTSSLRMHPPLFSSSVAKQAKVVQSQSTLTSSPNSEGPRPLSIAIFDDRASARSEESIDTTHSCHALAELDNSSTKARNQDTIPRDSEKEGSERMIPKSAHDPFLRDRDYLEAMRLWCLEKENDALEMERIECKAARRVKAAVYTMARATKNHGGWLPA